MGYFFRPHTRGFTRNHKSMEEYKEIMETLDKLHPSPPKNRYSLKFGDGKESPTWRTWGYFIHDEEFYDIINDLFIIHKGEYGDNLYELKRPDDGCDDFTREDFELFWKMLKETIRITGDKHLLEGDGADALKDSLEYIMFSGWDFFEAY